MAILEQKRKINNRRKNQSRESNKEVKQWSLGYATARHSTLRRSASQQLGGLCCSEPECKILIALGTLLGDREDDFFCISFPNSFDAENLSVCNEKHYELTFLSRVFSTLTAPLWINTLILVYLISI